MTVEVGQILNNRYRIDKSLGRGGMAEVFKVWDSKRATILALKLLWDDLSQDPAFLRRFSREAQNLSDLQHPNIVRFYGQEKDGDHIFLLMDYIDGPTLRREIRRKESPYSAEEMLEIIKPVCLALNYAHHQGVIHCDIKPANIMLDSKGMVFLADFGIARLGEGAATSTLLGAGTPAYMAPEQILGKDPTPQSDIYSLGIVIYEMLTGGERPFNGETAQISGSSAEKVRWEQLHSKPPSIRKLNPAVSKQLEASVMRCLEKDPKSRYASTLDLFCALADLESSETNEQQLLRNYHTPVNNNQLPRSEISIDTPKKSKVGWVSLLIVIGLVFISISALLISRGRSAIIPNIFPTATITPPPLIIEPTQGITLEPTPLPPLPTAIPLISLPVQIGTPLPGEADLISIQNASSMIQLAAYKSFDMADEIKLSTDQTLLALISSNQIAIYETANLQPVIKIEATSTCGSNWSPLVLDADFNFAAAINGTLVERWDIRSGTRLEPIQAGQQLDCLQLGISGKSLAVRSLTKQTFFYDLESGNPVNSPSDRFYAVNDNILNDLLTGDRVLGEKAIHAFAFSPDNKYFVMSYVIDRWQEGLGAESIFHVWDLQSKTLVLSKTLTDINTKGNITPRIIFFSNDILLFSEPSTALTTVYNLAKGRDVFSVVRPKLYAVSADSKFFAALQPKRLTIYDTFTGNNTGIDVDYGNTAQIMAFSTDGSKLYIGKVDGSIEILDRKTLMKLGDSTGTSPVINIISQQNGNMLVHYANGNLVNYSSDLKTNIAVLERIKKSTEPDWSSHEIGYSAENQSIYHCSEMGITRITTTSGLIDTLSPYPCNDISQNGLVAGFIELNQSPKFWKTIDQSPISSWGKISPTGTVHNIDLKPEDNSTYIGYSPSGDYYFMTKGAYNGGATILKMMRSSNSTQEQQFLFIGAKAVGSSQDLFVALDLPENCRIEIWQRVPYELISRINTCVAPDEFGYDANKNLTILNLSQMIFSPDDSMLAVSTSDGLRIYDVFEGNLITSLPDVRGGDMFFTSDGRFFIQFLRPNQVNIFGVLPESSLSKYQPASTP